ncbi:MAG: M1 family metallopeptidase [Actinomycetota bacterium]|nr:M1 family metallopeptidase [Actinomycetota bacterium]
MPSEADYRLPRSVIPSHYELALTPDLEGATFGGHVVIDVDVIEAVSEIVLNTAELTMHSAVLSNDDGGRLDATTESDEDAERTTLTLASPLDPGPWRLEISFDGILNDDLRGFYRSVYTDPNGDEKTIATTQFEATEARRAFPCWDEPDLKATFGVTLMVDDGLTVISNGAEIDREPAGDGKVAVRFADTMKMSTYLVAFIVGELDVTDTVDVDGIPLQIAFPPGKGHLTDFALDIAAHSLRYYAEYYDIPYPGGKMDKIAIPDFAWGAMENLGAVTYRESALLVDVHKATQSEMMRVAEIVAHEIAHMWFGDLVTMKWWNGIWLNEAFATFASMKCVDAYRPDWKMWLTFSGDRVHSMETDALVATRPIEIPVASPEEANAMFDSLTYEKGASILRMLEQYLGEDAFRLGVSNYLKENAYGNTEGEDLWSALEEASGEPVMEIMDTWIFQGGFPRLRVEGEPGAYLLTQEQFRYLGDGDQHWKLPVLLRSSEGAHKLLLSKDSATIDAGDDLVVNAGGDGFYRVAYSPELRTGIRRRLPSLSAEERYATVSDAWADVLKGGTDAADYLALVGELGGESEVDVWQRILSGLGELDRVVSTDVRPALQGFVRNLVSGKVDEMGWSPVEDEDDRSRKLRGALLAALGNLGDDPATQRRAHLVHEEVISGGGTVDAEVADAALSIVAANGDIDDFERFLTISEESDAPQEVIKYLRAAAIVPGRAASEKLFQMVLDGDVRRQDSFWIIAVMFGHRENGPGVWELMKENWDDLLGQMPPSTGRRILDPLPNRSEPEVAKDIEAWLADHPILGGEKFAEQQLELLKVRVGLRERESTRLAASLRSE